MLILGHPLIPSSRFVFIKNTDGIHSSANNDMVYFEAHPKNLELAQYCFENSVHFSVVFLSHKIETDTFFYSTLSSRTIAFLKILSKPYSPNRTPLIICWIVKFYFLWI